MGRVRANLESRVRKGAMSEEQARKALALLSGELTYDNFKVRARRPWRERGKGVLHRRRSAGALSGQGRGVPWPWGQPGASGVPCGSQLSRVRRRACPFTSCATARRSATW